MATIKPRRGTSYPASGLVENELAVDTTNRRVYLGNAGGSGITVASHLTDYVVSIDGITGALTNINAGSITVTNTNAGATYYPVFSGGSGATGLFADIATTPLTYNPQAGLLNGRIFVASASTNVVKIDGPAGILYFTDGTEISTVTPFSTDHNGTVQYTFTSTKGFTFSSPSVSFTNGSWKYTFPQSNGASNQALTTNGAGTLSWSGVVNSVNGETGSVIGVATYTGTSPFTVSQNFNAGISANAGSTFHNAIVIVTNSTSGVDPLYVQHNTNNGLKVSSTGQGRQGSIRLGNSTTSGFNTYITQTDGTLTVYNGISAGSGTITMAIGITGGVTISPTINGATFNQIIRSTSGISASGAVTGGSWMFAQDGYRIGSSAVSAKTGTTYTFGAADDGKIFTSSNAATQTFTIPTGLPIGFNCTVIQIGTGGVAITGASGVTLNSYNSKYNLLGQHASASIVSYTTNVFNLSGGLT